MYKEALAEFVEELRNKDLKKLEEYELAHAVSLDVENYIKREMSKRKNKNKIDSYRHLLNVIEIDAGGRLLCIDSIKEHLKSNYYETQAKDMLLRYCIKLHQETSS